MEFKNTIITPKTDFPMKAGLPAREPGMLEKWYEDKVYETLIEKNEGKLFLNYDNDYIRKKNCSVKHSSYGLKKDYDYYADELKSDQDGQSFTFHDGKKSFEAQTKLLGEHNIENLVGAIAVAKELGISDKDIKFAIRRIKSVPHRLELTTKGNLSIIDDSYNNTISF